MGVRHNQQAFAPPPCTSRRGRNHLGVTPIQQTLAEGAKVQKPAHVIMQHLGTILPQCFYCAIDQHLVPAAALGVLLLLPGCVD
jgi:hypothetical protein